MEKRGFRRIGYVNNMREYPFRLRELAGISYFDFGEFDEFIDAQWDARAGERLEPGTEVRVVAQENLTLRVEPI